jgi:hypothetical protein
MSDTTRIFDLPTDPMNGGSISVSNNGSNNINMSIAEQPTIHNATSGISLDTSTINQIVTGLQQATSSGLTQLPSRDIPTSTQAISQDPYIQPNYIPPPSTNSKANYIEEQETNEEIVYKEGKRETIVNHLENIYNEIQFPILIAVLYFLFQLPIVKSILFRYFPILFFKDGNINIYGLFFLSCTFSIVYYFLFKILTVL